MSAEKHDGYSSNYNTKMYPRGKGRVVVSFLCGTCHVLLVTVQTTSVDPVWTLFASAPGQRHIGACAKAAVE